ncbi:MAG: bifunctional hydroxymethylpyrimidine kinase/phosphomethylpyrimidine kinase [Campylobacterales bacterium]|nr:bifunctional hydroxymethylpyrimidine kinase/phosphomethylpyrimidine kinase [Campylobacterales bacterium]
MKKILTIAGSDSSGGAGIQADIKTAEAFGVYSASVLTAVTAQNTLGVSMVKVFDGEFIKEQFYKVTTDFQIDAIKIGMLANCEVIETVKEFIKYQKIPIVLDPVSISRAGSKLLEDDAIESLKGLFPYVSLITPNRYEAKLLFDLKDTSLESISKINAPCKVLVKNIEPSSNFSKDVLITGEKIESFEDVMVIGSNTHGTGCSYSTALACSLAENISLSQAVKKSKKFIGKAISNAPDFGKGNGPINHKKGF